MDISRVVSDVGAMTVKYPVKTETSKHEVNTASSELEKVAVDRLESPQKQVAKIVLSAEELAKQRDSTESASRGQSDEVETKGANIDEYA